MAKPASPLYSLAEQQVASAFKDAGWEVQAQPEGVGADLVLRKDTQTLVVEVKAARESRTDRLIPLLSQAVLQAQAYAQAYTHAYARDHTPPAPAAQALAVICLEELSPKLLLQLTAFAEAYIPHVPIGLIWDEGRARHFRGAGLEALNTSPPQRKRTGALPKAQPVNLFSDLNQWMLKVLLAPELPAEFINAPRARFNTGHEFASAANVSTMSASRFLQQLRSEGFLDAHAHDFVLVRRRELFERWRASAHRTTVEQPAHFLIRANAAQQLRQLVTNQAGEACLGLFAAADALRLGHVSGVPPHVYLAKLPALGSGKWRALAPARPGTPDLVLRQTATPQSVLRGAVMRDGILVSDIVQIWLDTSYHPTRGREQAELIYQQHLMPLIQQHSE